MNVLEFLTEKYRSRLHEVYAQKGSFQDSKVYKLSCLLDQLVLIKLRNDIKKSTSHPKDEGIGLSS